MSEGSDRRRQEPGAWVRADEAIVLGEAVILPAQLEWRVSAAGGPGGQHANRARTRVALSVDLGRVDLPEPVRQRLITQLGPVLRTSASRYRSQAQNRRAALDQLAARLSRALAPRAPRRATAPTRASRERRLEDKRARSRLKAQRRTRDD